MKKAHFQTTNEFLDELKSLNNNCSDGQAGRILGVKSQAVSNWRAGRAFFDDEVCFRVAKELGLKPEYVVACIHAERAKNDQARTVWEHIAVSFAPFARAAVFVLVLGVLAHSFPV